MNTSPTSKANDSDKEVPKPVEHSELQVEAVAEALRIQEELTLEQADEIETLKSQVQQLTTEAEYSRRSDNPRRDYAGSRPQDQRFMIDGKQYCFIVPAFVLDKRRLTPELALEDLKVLRKLVEMRSGVIKQINNPDQA